MIYSYDLLFEARLAQERARQLMKRDDMII